VISEFVEAGGYRERRLGDGVHWLESGSSPQLEILRQVFQQNS
jgi:hypothetical protein